MPITGETPPYNPGISMHNDFSDTAYWFVPESQLSGKTFSKDLHTSDPDYVSIYYRMLPVLAGTNMPSAPLHEIIPFDASHPI